jgi:hypothetical protein
METFASQSRSEQLVANSQSPADSIFSTVSARKGESMKRIVVAIFFGLVAGALCASGAFMAGLLTFSLVNLIWVLLNRAVMGFAIGISGLKLHWAWNGIVVGLAVGSIFSYFLFMHLGPGPLPLVNLFVNGLFGLMIEFFTTKVFKQPSLAVALAATR